LADLVASIEEDDEDKAVEDRLDDCNEEDDVNEDDATIEETELLEEDGGFDLESEPPPHAERPAIKPHENKKRRVYFIE
jgi:hypothetical protein